jgi:hypothetical protein
MGGGITNGPRNTDDASGIYTILCMHGYLTVLLESVSITEVAVDAISQYKMSRCSRTIDDLITE